jgi:hypothetical protein
MTDAHFQRQRGQRRGQELPGRRGLSSCCLLACFFCSRMATMLWNMSLSVVKSSEWSLKKEGRKRDSLSEKHSDWMDLVAHTPTSEDAMWNGNENPSPTLLVASSLPGTSSSSSRGERRLHVRILRQWHQLNGILGFYKQHVPTPSICYCVGPDVGCFAI